MHIQEIECSCRIQLPTRAPHPVLRSGFRALATMSDLDDIMDLDAAGSAPHTPGQAGGSAPHTPRRHDEDEGDYDSDATATSKELVCDGPECVASNKGQCQIAKAQGSSQRTKWGKRSKRKVMTRSGKKKSKVVSTGSWCYVCYSVWRYRFAKKYKNNISVFRTTLASDKDLEGRFKKARAEYLHRKTGGASRVILNPVEVTKEDEAYTDVEEPPCPFYSLKRFKKDIGSPRKLGVTIETVRRKNGKTVKGVYVPDEEKEGIYMVKRGMRSSARMKKTEDDGKFVLDDEQMKEAFDAAAEEGAGPDTTSFPSLGELHEKKKQMDKAEEAKKAKAAAAPESSSQHDGVESDQAGEDSSSSSSEGPSESVSDGDDQGKPKHNKVLNTPDKATAKAAVAAKGKAQAAKAAASKKKQPIAKQEEAAEDDTDEDEDGARAPRVRAKERSAPNSAATKARTNGSSAAGAAERDAFLSAAEARSVD